MTKRTIGILGWTTLLAVATFAVLVGFNQAHAAGDPQHCNAKADLTSYYELSPGMTDPALVYQFSGEDASKLVDVWAAHLGPLPNGDGTPGGVIGNVYVGFDTRTGDTDWFFYDVDGCYDANIQNVAVTDTQAVFGATDVDLNLDANHLPGTVGGPAGFLVKGGLAT